MGSQLLEISPHSTNALYLFDSYVEIVNFQASVPSKLVYLHIYIYTVILRLAIHTCRTYGRSFNSRSFNGDEFEELHRHVFMV